MVTRVQPAAPPVFDTEMTDVRTPEATALKTVVHSSFRAAKTDWDQLAKKGLGNAYQSQGWLEAWSETLGKANGTEPFIACGRVNGRTVVILPLGRHHSAGMTALSFLGHQNGNQNTGIWDADFYSEVTQAEIDGFLQEVCKSLEADSLVLSNVPEEWHGRTHPLILKTATPSPSPIFARDLPQDFEALFRDTHSKSSRKNLLRKQRHLQAVDGYKVVEAESSPDIRRGLDAFLKQRQTRSQEAGIPNVFSEDSARKFLERLLGLSPETGDGTDRELSLWLLEADGEIRATYLCAHQGGTIYAYSNSVAHDELMANSPGLVLIKKIIERSCADPEISTLDLGLGEERYKTAWAEPVALKDSHVAVSFKGAVRKSAAKLLTQTKAGIRSSKLLWPLVKRLRKWQAAFRRPA